MSQVPTVRTPITAMGVRDALFPAWTARFGDIPANSSIALLLAQIGQETGWSACDNFNIEGVKHVAGGSDDYCVFLTEERYEADRAREIVKMVPGATLKTTIPDSDDMLTVELPQMFRAFPDLASGVDFYLGLLAGRFKGAWPYVLSCDVESFVNALKAEGYFTAALSLYLADVYARFGQVVCEWLGFANVAAFQKYAGGLVVDNDCGEKTAAAMATALDQSCSPPEVA